MSNDDSQQISVAELLARNGQGSSGSGGRRRRGGKDSVPVTDLTDVEQSASSHSSDPEPEPVASVLGFGPSPFRPIEPELPEPEPEPALWPASIEPEPSQESSPLFSSIPEPEPEPAAPRMTRAQRRAAERAAEEAAAKESEEANPRSSRGHRKEVDPEPEPVRSDPLLSLSSFESVLDFSSISSASASITEPESKPEPEPEPKPEPRSRRRKAEIDTDFDISTLLAPKAEPEPTKRSGRRRKDDDDFDVSTLLDPKTSLDDLLGRRKHGSHSPAAESEQESDETPEQEDLLGRLAPAVADLESPTEIRWPADLLTIDENPPTPKPEPEPAKKTKTGKRPKNPPRDRLDAEDQPTTAMPVGPRLLADQGPQLLSSGDFPRSSATSFGNSEQPYRNPEPDDEPTDVNEPVRPEPAERSQAAIKREWLQLGGQTAAAAVAGVLLFEGFQRLWEMLAWVALALAVTVILGLVALVRVLRRTDDLLSIVIAIVVGVFVTMGPLAFMLSTG